MFGIKEVSRKPEVDNAEKKTGWCFKYMEELLVPAHKRQSEKT